MPAARGVCDAGEGLGWGGKGEAEEKEALVGLTAIRAWNDLAQVPTSAGMGAEGSRMDGFGWALLPPLPGTAWLLKIPAACSAPGTRLPFQHQHNDSSYITQQPIQQAHSSKEKEN